MTDSPRAATEMLLVSQAADNAVGQIDFSPMSGKTVYLDASGMDKDLLDKGYLVSLVRQCLLASGAMLQDEKTRAEYVVELRAGGLGTDRHSLLVGTPAVSLPSVLPGLPTSLPEIALVKNNDQRGVAKVAVFAYNRISGRALWQSGTVEAESRSKDTWVLGAGPFSRGSIRRRTELAGQPLPSIPSTLFKTADGHVQHGPSSEQFFDGHAASPPPPPIPGGVQGVTGAAIFADKPVVR